MRGKTSNRRVYNMCLQTVVERLMFETCCAARDVDHMFASPSVTRNSVWGCGSTVMQSDMCSHVSGTRMFISCGTMHGYFWRYYVWLFLGKASASKTCHGITQHITLIQSTSELFSPENRLQHPWASNTFGLLVSSIVTTCGPMHSF